MAGRKESKKNEKMSAMRGELQHGQMAAPFSIEEKIIIVANIIEQAVQVS